MNRIKLSLQNIILIIVGVSFLPRLFSSFLYSPGTINIAVFWIAPFVLLPEFINGFGSRKISLEEIPKVTYRVFIFCLVVIIITFIYRDQIYSRELSNLYNVRRILYLLHPILLFSLLPLVENKNKNAYKKKFLILSLGFTLALGLHLFIYAFHIGSFLNNITAKISAFISSFFWKEQIHVIENRFFTESFAIDVLGGCSATPHMLNALFSMLVLYLCCKIKSIKYLILIGIIAPFIAFSTNAIRISILAYFVANDNTKSFDFWHSGFGSLLFYFISMFISCYVYYYLWNKENPIES